MYAIRKALPSDYRDVAHIGRISVEEAHRDSCSKEDMETFLRETYHDKTIEQELLDPSHSYHILHYDQKPAGFSKVVLNAPHPNISGTNVTKLDRIYLLGEYLGLGLGGALLNFNIEFAKANSQEGMWLFTWTGNTRAINFYHRAGFTIIGSHRFKVTETHYNQHHQMFLQL